MEDKEKFTKLKNEVESILNQIEAEKVTASESEVEPKKSYNF